MSWRQRSGAALLVGVLAFAFIGPWVVLGDPAAQDLSASLLPPSLANAAQWLGTDAFGRPVLLRLAHAAQLSLSLALLCVVSAAVPGTLLGVWAAWRGGWVERVLVSIADAVLALPGLLLVLLLATVAAGQFWTLYVGLSLAMWVEYFRVVRASAKGVLLGSPVEAARLLGFGPGLILKRHVLPELMPVLATVAGFGLAQAVLGLAALGFINVGLKPPTPELGLMMTEFMPHYAEAPWLVAAPVGVLLLTLLSLVLMFGETSPEAR